MLHQGEFEANKYHGYGSFRFPDGSVYEGSFKDNQMHGKGVYTDAHGVEWKGKFYNGVGPGLAAGTVVADRCDRVSCGTSASEDVARRQSIAA